MHREKREVYYSQP